MVTFEEILKKLPYDEPFLFVDELLRVDENGVEGTFTFKEDLWFYNGHFKGNPVTPGVILTETMAQIGVVCFGIFLLGPELAHNTGIALSSFEIEFLKPVLPGEKVTVVSKKIYYRFGKLKCEVSLRKADGEEACNGTISGIIKQ